MSSGSHQECLRAYAHKQYQEYDIVEYFATKREYVQAVLKIRLVLEAPGGYISYISYNLEVTVDRREKCTLPKVWFRANDSSSMLALYILTYKKNLFVVNTA